MGELLELASFDNKGVQSRYQRFPVLQEYCRLSNSSLRPMNLAFFNFSVCRFSRYYIFLFKKLNASDVGIQLQFIDEGREPFTGERLSVTKAVQLDELRITYKLVESYDHQFP